jgi:hypothetical protein
MPAALLLCVAAAVAAVLGSCSRKADSVAAERENLFALGYGTAEDQLDLFQLGNQRAPLKSRIAMREGIFYIANGNGAKVVRYSSFGDVLSMIYNPERNPEPLVLKAQPKTAEGGAGPPGAAGRHAVPYPFRAVGELAVDSGQTVYVEDRLPPERRVQDKDSSGFLDYVVLRFGKDGQYLDYLGQEGIGGTPFPFIVGIYTTSSDDCVVVSMTESAWLIHYFDSRGVVISAVKLRRDGLPTLDGSRELIASLDRIAADPEGRGLFIKIDYYREGVDPSTKSDAGPKFASSWVYRMNPKDASFSERWEIPAEEKKVKSGSDGQTVLEVRVPQLIGAAGREFFLMSGDDEGRTYLSVYDRVARAMTKYSIDIAPDELYYTSFFLSKEGILCALLGSLREARIVWWRFDKLLRGLKPGEPAETSR